MMTGEYIGTIAVSEPGAGSDLQAVNTSVDKNGDDWIINGQRTFISNGQLSDLGIVVCRTAKDTRSKGTSLFVVERDADGFTQGSNFPKIGIRAPDTSELFLDNVRVPASSLLGEAGMVFTGAGG